MRHSYFGNTLTIDIDPESILNQLDDEDIVAYVEDNNLIASESDLSSITSEEQLVSHISYVMNGNGTTNIPRTKTELKEYICNLIDFYHKLS